jgi:hypothetical protein
LPRPSTTIHVEIDSGKLCQQKYFIFCPNLKC